MRELGLRVSSSHLDVPLTTRIDAVSSLARLAADAIVMHAWTAPHAASSGGATCIALRAPAATMVVPNLAVPAIEGLLQLIQAAGDQLQEPAYSRHGGATHRKFAETSEGRAMARLYMAAVEPLLALWPAGGSDSATDDDEPLLIQLLRSATRRLSPA
jgi:hypothetical protein